MKLVNGGVKLFICVAGIYLSFLTWALVQEPLATKVWPHSQRQFQFPNVVAVAQALCAMVIGLLYLQQTQQQQKRGNGGGYRPWQLIKDHTTQLLLISFTQSASTPLATYSLGHVDYLTYMLAKSCKMIPVLLIHLLYYRTPISSDKKVVALLVTVGVTVFTLGGGTHKKKKSSDADSYSGVMGFVLLGVSLFLDGLTNATQDTMLRTNAERNKVDEKNDPENKNGSKTITAAHLMFALNLFIVLWNIPYLAVFHRSQVEGSLEVLEGDPQVLIYLLAYAVCGAVGQCFIFYTLEQYGSLVLIMITVTRKMMSMLLSIAVFGKTVDKVQWVGIFIVFGGILWEAMNKRRKVSSLKKTQ
ncbi:UDP-galactose transporter HUT1 KNAG_0D00770 [Huiozyma naganishii CBS 8797]|uniref:UDP-galactose transporter homolog 1 n=1 Tax=Huiozyma naganishii (strain ATCC MYA-139 / BCRC 22969 / CBS 8797 / KCTC 17520 / NBRC 10181 / NCYC 3082 / Yp74L-3) TaxID=1071383 RepID=J7S5G1_HUIN7|nr:hypothetical protein KNAG_0D00770 [Kazachstania naganishii CBS 8797]CCK69829.1 hypothetical protein KNAG_0D00770 [Kazachstania naganishii CBS 8797]